jgi:hypothetical protein
MTVPAILPATFAMVILLTSEAAQSAVNVSQHHNHLNRDGLYVDPAFTPSAAAALKRDLSFDGTISGNVYAQPLYIEGGPSGKAMVIAVTESNNIYALDAADGSVIWQRNVGAPVPRARFNCGNIDPLGITGTPVVDLPSRALLFDAMTSPDGGVTKRHLIYSLNVDTGATNSGWPVDVNLRASYQSTAFTSGTQNQRAALTIVGGAVYVGYGGFYGDCDVYYGWLVGVPLNNPTNVTAWATPSRGGAIWAVNGIASDGTNLFAATGNTFGVSVWSGGEALLRFSPGPTFSGLAVDYWAPANWQSLDGIDQDIGGCGALPIDVPGATPSQLLVALGKDGNAYLANRANLGGVGSPASQAPVGSPLLRVAPAAYRTSLGTYIAFCDGNDYNNNLIAIRISAANPPGISTAWTVAQHGHGSPFVTSTDGTNNFIVWGIGAEGDQRLRAFSGDTGAVVYSGGGTSELMSGTRHFSTGIVARGRIYIANDSRVYAFTVPVPPIVLTNVVPLPSGAVQFSFTNTPGLSFTVFATTDVTLPFSNWTNLGAPTELAAGQFQFIDAQAVGISTRFYRVRSP